LATLKLMLGGDERAAEFGSKITKEDLYGGIKKIVEANGVELERGYLLPDGNLIRRSQLTIASLDSEGTPIEAPQATVDDQVVTPRPSSFDVGVELESVPLSRLADFAVGDVYVIQADLPAGLYATTFNYRASLQPREAFVLVREDNTFLLVGEAKAAPFVGRTVSYEFFDAITGSESEIDPLDFSMM
jgi:hypothetical protein